MLINKSQINRNISILLLLFFSIFFNACRENNRIKVSKTEGLEESIKIKRFERELFYIDQNHLEDSLKALESRYTEFYRVYFEQMMGFGSIQNPNLKFIVKDFINNQDFKVLVKDCDSIYNDEKIKELEKAIADVFVLYKSVYPKDTIPQIVTFVSGFANGVANLDGYIGIGLDLFLGANYKFYPSLDLPEYLTRRYTPDHLLPIFVKGLATYKYENNTSSTTLLDRMIYEGKLLYFCSQFLPETPDSLIIGYTDLQMQWCKENEGNIYQLLVQENLYSTDYLNYRKYTEEAPYTVNLTAESAPRIAWYCGWQIVKKYMEVNNNLSLEDLMNEKDSQKILRASKYKGK